jgi:hypothetical protein
MLKVLKKPPLTTVVALRSPGTKGKVEEKKYPRSASLLKFGSEEMSSTNTFAQLFIKIIRISYEFSSIFKAGSSVLSYGLFWGMIYGITASFLKRTLNASSGTMLNASSGTMLNASSGTMLNASSGIMLNASSGTTTTTIIMLAYYLTWMLEPIVGLVFGCLFTVCISSPQEESAKRTRLFWATLLSAALLFASSIIFFVYIPRLGDQSSEAEITLSTMFTVTLFAAMMISINGYMSVMNLMAQPKADNAAHYGLTSGFNAVGQMIATGIIIYFSLNNSVDNVAPAILSVGFVFISISIIISLTCGQYWPCCGCRIYDPCCVFIGLFWLYWESDDKSPPSDHRRYVADEVHIWLVFLFVIACWIALFAFLPWSVDWYASTYYSEDVGSPEYNRGVWIASCARFYQQLVMGGCSFFMLFVSMCFFKNSYRWNKRRQEKLKIRAMWIFTLIGLTVYSACLLVAAFIDSPDLAYAAFVMSGIGMAAIFPLNSFQTYYIFSLNDNNNNNNNNYDHNNNNDHNNNKTAAASPFTCTNYCDNRLKINAAAMIGQIIILSVTYFAFHFNYKWVLVTGSIAGGTAIFLGILLMVVIPYNFENVTIIDKVPAEVPDPTIRPRVII